MKIDSGTVIERIRSAYNRWDNRFLNATDKERIELDEELLNVIKSYGDDLLKAIEVLQLTESLLPILFADVNGVDCFFLKDYLIKEIDEVFAKLIREV